MLPFIHPTFHASGPGSHPVDVTVTINVEDENDNFPEVTINILSNPETDTSSSSSDEVIATIPENNLPNTFVAQVTVADVDRGNNGTVSCDIHKQKILYSEGGEDGDVKYQYYPHRNRRRIYIPSKQSSVSPWNGKKDSMTIVEGGMVVRGRLDVERYFDSDGNDGGSDRSDGDDGGDESGGDEVGRSSTRSDNKSNKSFIEKSDHNGHVEVGDEEEGEEEEEKEENEEREKKEKESDGNNSITNRKYVIFAKPESYVKRRKNHMKKQKKINKNNINKKYNVNNNNINNINNNKINKIHNHNNNKVARSFKSSDADENDDDPMSMFHSPPLQGLFGLFPRPSLQQGETEHQVLALEALDREAAPYGYKLTIVCRDFGTPAKRTEKILTVKLIDENDNSPHFSKTLYRGTIRENAASAETPVVVLKAKDADEAMNGQVRYSIQTNTFQPEQAAEWVRVDGLSGGVFVERPLDREKFDKVTFKVCVCEKKISFISNCWFYLPTDYPAFC